MLKERIEVYDYLAFNFNRWRKTSFHFLYHISLNIFAVWLQRGSNSEYIRSYKSHTWEEKIIKMLLNSDESLSQFGKNFGKIFFDYLIIQIEMMWKCVTSLLLLYFICCSKFVVIFWSHVMTLIVWYINLLLLFCLLNRYSYFVTGFNNKCIINIYMIIFI